MSDGMQTMDTLCVAHLVRACNGPEPLRRFLASYLRHPAGAPHELLLILKGFGHGRLPADHEALLEGVPHDRILVPEAGFDIGAYAFAARRTAFHSYCFFNSFSEILDGNWLEKLASQARRNCADLVAATGSWASHLSLAREGHAFTRGDSLPSAPARLARRLLLWYLARHFDDFPNYHLRTNGFLVRRDLLLASARGRFVTKMSAYAFESGRSGLSANCVRAGGRLLVVGRDGESYSTRDWPASMTFWQGDQQNLLVADNQTRRYQAADPTQRDLLARQAWGHEARPSGGVPPTSEDVAGCRGDSKS